MTPKFGNLLKRLRLARSHAVLFALAIPFVVTANAQAVPSRGVCPAGAMVNNNFSASAGVYWKASGQCQIRAAGSYNPTTTAAYGNISVPLQTGSAAFDATTIVTLYGGDNEDSLSTRAGACAYAFYVDGNLASSTNIYTTSGWPSTHQSFNLGTLTVPQYGAYTVNFAANIGAGVDMTTVSWSGSAQKP